MVKNTPANAGDVDLIPQSGRSPAEGSDNPLQYSCLENSLDRGAWQATVHGVTKESNTTLTKTTHTATTDDQKGRKHLRMTPEPFYFFQSIFDSLFSQSVLNNTNYFTNTANLKTA